TPPPRPVSRPRRRVPAAALLAVLAAMGLFATWRLIRPPRASRVPAQRYLAVLPFRDLSGLPGGQLIGDGLVETVSARLQNVAGIQVVTPSASVAVGDREPAALRPRGFRGRGRLSPRGARHGAAGGAPRPGGSRPRLPRAVQSDPRAPLD